MSTDVNPVHHRAYDIVLYGATSFVGQLVARYFATQLIQPDGGSS